MTTTLKSKLSGVITALVTPFKNGELDLESFRKLVRSQLEAGVNGFVINGTTAESPTLKPQEVKTLFDLARTECAGKAALVIGTGSNSTQKTVEYTREVSTWGADAALVVVPYYNKPPQRGLIAHFKQVAECSSLPILLYNVPSRTVANLEPASVAELSQHANIIGIKDATGDMAVLEQLRMQTSKDFLLLSGDDGTCVDFCARGGHGVIAVASHILAAEMKSAIQSGDSQNYKKYASLIQALYREANPIPVKMALHWMGVIASQEMRLPLVELDAKFHKELKSCLKELGKI